jgi:hypothetical protein
LASPASIPPTTAPVQVTVPELTVSAPSLKIDQLKNAKYQLGARDDHAVVPLVDGKYQQGTDATSSNYAYIHLLDQMAFGDLNADGVNDVSALVAENYGGSGTFVFLVVFLNENGKLVQAAATLVDDRPILDSLTIGGGQIGLIVTTHKFDDPMCCPSLNTTRIYQFSDGHLRLRHMRSATPPDNREHEISIASLGEDAIVSGTTQLTGGITIAPFENNLSWFIYDEAGTELAKGFVTVAAPALGNPGTFDSTIPLEGIPTGTNIYLEVRDINAADGSLFALDSVKLVVK